MFQTIKEIWKDPVWSKVISAGIIGTLVLVGGFLHARLGSLVPQSLIARIAIGAIAAALIIILFALSYFSRRPLKATMYLYEAGFSHAPVICLEIRNSAWKPIWISAVEFVTKEQWDMPDPMREGVGAPIESRLPPNSRL